MSLNKKLAVINFASGAFVALVILIFVKKTLGVRYIAPLELAISDTVYFGMWLLVVANFITGIWQLMKGDAKKTD